MWAWGLLSGGAFVEGFCYRRKPAFEGPFVPLLEVVELILLITVELGVRHRKFMIEMVLFGRTFRLEDDDLFVFELLTTGTLGRREQ